MKYMKRLLLPLLAAIALPSAIKAEEFVEIKPKNIYSYKKSSLVKYEKKGKRYIEFIGTTLMPPCIDDFDCQNSHIKKYLKQNNNEFGEVNALWKYSIDCVDKTFNREKDFASWKPLWIDKTSMAVADKYCPVEQWIKLLNK